MPRRRPGLVAAGRLLATGILALCSLPLIAPPALADEPLYKETYLISTSDEDAVFGEDSEFAAISKDGLHAFWTTEESLLSADSDNDNVDIYERIDNRTTRLVTPGGDEDATFLAASEDGTKVFFYLGAFGTDIYRRDLDADPPTTTNMTPGTSGVVRFKAIDTSGHRMFFETSDPLVGDADNETDVYMSSDGAVSGISTVGDEPCGANFSGSTPDGNHVFFLTEEVLDASDGDSDPGGCYVGYSDNGTPDIHRWSGGSVTNVTPQGGCAPGSGTGCATDKFAWSSLDGQRVIFNSSGIFVSGRYDGWCLDDVYQTIGGAVSKLSVSPFDGTPEYCSVGKGYYPAAFLGASEDATKVFWVSREPALGGDEQQDIFLSTNGSAGTLLTPGTSQNASFVWNTPDGSRMFYATSEAIVDDADGFVDVFQVHGGATTKVTKGPLGGNGPSNSYFGGATDDASHIFFTTGEPLTTDDLDPTGVDVFDRHDGDSELISTGPLAKATNSNSAAFDATTQTADRVFFSTTEKLVPEDTDSRRDVYMRWRGDRSLAPGPTVRVDEFALDQDFVELRKSGGTEIPPEDQFPDESAPYRIVAYDGDGARIGGHTISPSLLRNQFRMLFSDTHGAANDTLGIDLPAVGQLCFTQGAGELPVTCVAWGCIASPVQAGITRVAAPPGGLSQQRQGSGSEVFHVAAPTPGAENIAGTEQEPCPAEPEPDPDPEPADPPAPPAPNPPAPPPSPTPFGGAGPFVPLDTTTVLPITPVNPQEGGYAAACPAALGASCDVRVVVQEAASGARARAAKAGDVLAQGAATIAPGATGRVGLTFTEAGEKILEDLETVPVSVTVTVAAGGRTATSTARTTMLPNLGTDPAKLQIERAGVKGGKLDVLARITRRASGEVRVAYEAAGRTTRFDAKIRKGTIKISRRLPSSQRRSRTGIVTFEWRGNDRVRPTEVRLRAAARKAQLRRRSLSMKDGRLRVSGTISSRAGGVVRLLVGYVDQGEVKTWSGRAKISGGRWSSSDKLPEAARDDGYLSIQFTGDRTARGGPVRGEQDGKALWTLR